MKKKGFTLIELLAVIVILAVIALIATPIILNMISTAKKGAAVDSAYGYIDAIETNNAMNSIDSEKYPLITDTDVTEINKKVKIKGEKPASGTVTLEKGKVTTASMCINGYTVVYENNKAKATKKCDEKEPVEEPKGPTIIKDEKNEYTYEAVVYLDPTDLTKYCDAKNSESTPGTTKGCMKWYAYKYNEATKKYTLILDHNTTAKVAWNSSGSNADGMKEVADALTTDTAGWDSSLNAKLITADEIADITGSSSETTIKWKSSSTYANTVTDINTQNSWFYLDGGRNTNKISYSSTDGWQKQHADATTKSNYAWLYDYTYGCIAKGCNIEDRLTYGYNGYWTQTSVSGYADIAWGVGSDGRLNIVNVADYNSCGVRPVITF